MILGRFLGTLTAIILAVLFAQENIIAQILMWVVFALVGTFLGMLYSVFIGPMYKFSDTPLPQDGEDWWVKKYGPDLGKKAYKMWLEEIDAT